MKFIKNNKKILSLFTITLIVLNLFSIKTTNLKKDERAIFNKRTNDNDWGSNNIYYLDRHDVKCNPNEALQGFRLYRPASNKLSYKYVCKQSTEFVKEKSFYEDKTKANSVANDKHKSANYLDRHDIQCKKGYALQRFKLDREGNNIFYSYRCVQVSCGKSESFTTNETNDGGFQTVYLDRQDTRVKNDEVITGFRLISKNSQFSYKVNFCKLAKETPELLPVVTKNLSEKEKRNKFCKENCQFNPTGIKKMCRFTYGDMVCRRCTIKSGIKNDNEKKSLCETLCDGNELSDDKTCRFFGYLNNHKKDINQNMIDRIIGILK